MLSGYFWHALVLTPPVSTCFLLSLSDYVETQCRSGATVCPHPTTSLRLFLDAMPSAQVTLTSCHAGCSFSCTCATSNQIREDCAEREYQYRVWIKTKILDP